MTDIARAPGTDELEQRREGERRQGERRKPVVSIAAVGDFHAGEDAVGEFRPHFARVNAEADILLLAGDLTRWGTVSEMKVVVNELGDVEIPIVAVLGNHDHEAGQVDEICAVLRDRGIHLLEGDVFELDGKIGIAGVKGFLGGFGRRTLTPFGEAPIKDFVAASIEEARLLEMALRRISAPIRVALLHYSPVVDTVLGEPEQIYPFLGTDRLAEPLDRFGVAVAFHGHAHHGAFRGTTPGGTPVFNVSVDLLRREGIADFYYIHQIDLSGPDRADENVAAGSERPGG